jgi:transposase
LAGIETVAMDMWEPFVASTLAHVPGGRAKFVFDRFHVMKHMSEAVDPVRKAEHRRLRAEGDETLKGKKYLWLYTFARFEECPLRRNHLSPGDATRQAPSRNGR